MVISIQVLDNDEENIRASKLNLYKAVRVMQYGCKKSKSISYSLASNVTRKQNI